MQHNRSTPHSEVGARGIDCLVALEEMKGGISTIPGEILTAQYIESESLHVYWSL